MNDNATTLNEIKQMVIAFRKKRGWQKEDPKDAALSLMLESAEVLEHFQWLAGDEVMSNPKIKQAIGEEMSDVLWWIAILSDRLGIDMAEAFEAKIQKNAEKYPEEIFSPDISEEERRKAYYRIKAATRGGHPLYEPENDQEDQKENNT